MQGGVMTRQRLTLPLAPSLLLALLLAASACMTAARPTYVVSLSSTFRIPIAVGSQSIPYLQTADTGSGIVNFPCSSSCPFYYNPPNSTTSMQPTAAACASFEGGDAACTWNYTYHPSFEVISGYIAEDTLTLRTASPPLSFPALLGCTLNDTRGMSPCPSVAGDSGSFGGVDRGNSSIISQLYAAKKVDNTVGFCAPHLPPPLAAGQPISNANTTVYMTLGGARPVELSKVKRTDFLSADELALVGAANGWTEDIVARMSLRYLAVLTSVSFAGQTFHFNLTNGTANMDTGGGPVVSMPPALAAAYFNAVSAAVNASAPALNLTFDSLTHCVATLNTSSTHDWAAMQAVFPNITFVFRGRDKAKAVVGAQDLITQESFKLPSRRVVEGLCSVISVEPSSIPTAFWPSQPFFRGRYSGFDRRRNALLLSQPFPCVNVMV